MTALAADASRRTRNLQGKSIASYVVATSAEIYVGSLVCVRGSADNRVLAGTIAASRKFVGMSEERATGNTAGTVRCRVSWGYEALIDASTVVTAGFVGVNVTIGDDNLVSTAGATATDVFVGEVIQLDGGDADAWVALRQYSRNDS